MNPGSLPRNARRIIWAAPSRLGLDRPKVPIRSLGDRAFPLPETPEAIRHLLRGHGPGRIVVTV
jgi:hypothetical protein